jgi:hypothetical protein
MSFDGSAANSSGWFIRPKVRGIGSIGAAERTRSSSRIGHYAMATAEHREPCESRGSRTVLGAPGDETPLGDSTVAADIAGIVPTGPCIFANGSNGTSRRSTGAGSIWPSPSCSLQPVPRPPHPDATTLKREVVAWRSRRNTHNAKANWHFTSADARVKLKSLYPAL